MTIRSRCRLISAQRIKQPLQDRYATSSSIITRPSLNRALTAQDPYSRIRFHVGQPPNPLWRDILAYRYPGAMSIEAFALPFWTLLYSWSIGTGPHGLDIDEKDQINTFGLTISAVDSSHWASGLILKDDPESIIRQDITMDFEALRWSQMEDDDLDTRYLPEDWNPSIAPLFAHGYPLRLPRRFMSAVRANAQKMWAPGLEQQIHVRQTKTPYAFPHYRVIFKIELDNGEVVIGDASKGLQIKAESQLHYFPLPRTHPKASKLLLDKASPQCLQYWRAAPANPSGDNSLTTAGTVSPTSTVRTIGSQAVGDDATMRAAIAELAVSSLGTRISWDDPHILPPDLYSGNTLRGAWEYALASMMQEQKDPPLFHGSHASRIRRSNVFPMRFAYTAFSSESEPASETPRKRPVTSADFHVKPTYITENSTPLPKPASRVPRDIKDRDLRSRSPTINLLGSRSTLRLKNRTSPSPSSQTPRPTPKVVPDPPEPSVPDPLGWYRDLGVFPSTIFTDREKDDSAALIIAAARRKRSWEYHPDRVGGDGDKLAHVNYICDQLKSYTQRVQYSRTRVTS